MNIPILLVLLPLLKSSQSLLRAPMRLLIIFKQKQNNCAIRAYSLFVNSLKPNFILSLIFISSVSLAQDASHNQLQQLQGTLQGTLHGVMQVPIKITKQSNPLVFPRSFQQGFSMNPWSKNQQLPMRHNQQGYSGLPKGNPWAPVGDTQNIPLDQTAVIEKNPYTDARIPNQPQNTFFMPMPSAAYNPNQLMNSPYNYGSRYGYGSGTAYGSGTGSAYGPGYGYGYGYGSGSAYDGVNNGFAMPFGNQVWPTNPLWSGTNNGSSTMPFMPW